ncbi:MAG: alpha-hydroxy-acid oxidizing protein [Anaerolineae bacterium]
MTKVTGNPSIEERKVDHIRINLERDVQFPHLTTGLEHYRLLHQALPELNLAEVDPSVTLFNKTISAPILISSMTRAEMAHRINCTPAEAAQANRIALGRITASSTHKDPNLAYTLPCA